MSRPAETRTPFDELIAAGEDARLQLVKGALLAVETSGEHANAQAGLVTGVRAPYHRRPGDGDRPGGWWILVECAIQFTISDVLRPDVAGWLRERCPEPPRGFPVRVLPDWVCEVLSPSNLARDLVHKRRVYHQAKVGHYWIVDIQREEITVMRWAEAGWLVLDVLPVDGTFRAPPFEAAAIDWNAVFGKDG